MSLVARSNAGSKVFLLASRSNLSINVFRKSISKPFMEIFVFWICRLKVRIKVSIVLSCLTEYPPRLKQLVLIEECH
uniref:Uncharacterized protein n=1 Tax=uncultured marine virus TaxID=186617 RepID=A0A0F7L863_9VIRU|nr:hypothetical protein [uncultured marine virus]